MIQRVLLMMLALAFLPPVAGASELFGTIQQKGKPLKDAEITIVSSDKKVKTNAKGYYSVDLEPGVYTLKIKLPDGKIVEKKVDLFSDDTEANIKLD